MQYWIIVASRDHVKTGVEGGFCQACHGKKWPMDKMQAGDYVLFYSSKKEFGSNKPYQKFTAAGRISDDTTFRVQMNKKFKPYRKKVDFFDCCEVGIRPLLEKLHFVRGHKNWGYPLRYGFLEINRHDFELLFSIMRQF